ncbi:MAG: hypothetical protein LBI31_00665, partial [Zoogloeaceae bacterium]|nr:hypothetical protein [Zoogloeaceae bacterium]
DCYSIYTWVPKEAVFAGWRDMDAYMRENNLATVPTLLPPAQPPPPPPLPETGDKKKKKKGDSAESASGAAEAATPAVVPVPAPLPEHAEPVAPDPSAAPAGDAQETFSPADAPATVLTPQS